MRFNAFILLLGISAAASAQPAFEVVSAEFGLFNAMETGRPPFIPTPFVPLQEGQAYGWVIVVKTADKTVRWREEFTPSGSGDAAVTEREVTLYNGAVFNSRAIAKGDPAGTYRMRVSVNGKVVRTFEFRVE